jgi:ribosome-associated heat shock protein Hsp15
VQVEATNKVRIDKWLWAVRIYKTRSDAADACRLGRVTIGGQPVKPARDVRIGELILAKTGEIQRQLKVTAIIERRVSAALAKSCVEDLTPASELAKRPAPDFTPIALRPKGTGRPTKKDRRDLSKLFGSEDGN